MALGNVNIGLANFWKVTCLDKDGNIKWEEDNKNIKEYNSYSRSEPYS